MTIEEMMQMSQNTKPMQFGTMYVQSTSYAMVYAPDDVDSGGS
jgi:hypothetical protein